MSLSSQLPERVHGEFQEENRCPVQVARYSFPKIDLYVVCSTSLNFGTFKFKEDDTELFIFFNLWSTNYGRFGD